MTAHSPRPTSSDGPTRRGFLERVGVGAGAAVTVGVGSTQVPQFSPVGRADAIACGGLCIGAAAAGTGVAVGWALGEWDPLEDDSPPEGLSPDALQNQSFQTAKTRQSTNKSTFVDNQNIVSSGMEHAAYGDGKVAAIEALNAQKSNSEVQSAATGAIEPYETTVKKNYLKSWNETVAEYESMVSTVKSHSDLSLGDVFDPPNPNTDAGSDRFDSVYGMSEPEFGTKEMTLPDGSTLDVRVITVWGESSTGGTNGPLEWSADSVDAQIGGSSDAFIRAKSADGDTVEYLKAGNWNSLWDEIDATFTDVKDGLITWVDGVYGDVQAGDLNTEELLTPRELAQMSADEEGVNKAIADLMALNVPVDLEREATISVESENETATLTGMLAPTTPPSNGIQSGETYDPSTTDGDIYFNYDISQGSAVWTGYETAVDGGSVTFTSEPYEGTLFRINTTAGEEATVAAEDFTHDDSDGVWTVDISEQVETAITEIDEVEMVAESGDTQYQTIILDQPFTVEKIENSETGEEADSMEFSNAEPQDDTNYISEEEWKEMEQRNQELIDKYEESKNDDSSLVGDLDPDKLAQEYGGQFAGLVVIFVSVMAVVGWVTDSIPGMGD